MWPTVRRPALCRLAFRWASALLERAPLLLARDVVARADVAEVVGELVRPGELFVALRLLGRQLPAEDLVEVGLGRLRAGLLRRKLVADVAQLPGVQPVAAALGALVHRHAALRAFE